MTPRRVLPVVVSLIVAIVLPGCDRAPDHVTVAVALDDRNRRGVELAVREVNRQGGIRGVPLAIEGASWTDPGFSNPTATIEWADQLTRRRDVMGVIGHSDSSATLAAAGLYNERGLPHVVTIATNPEITRIGPWTFRLCLDDEAQGALLARHAVEDWNKRRVAMFYVNDDYGRGLARRFRDEVERLGGTVVASLFHDDRIGSDDAAQIERLVASWRGAQRPELVALLGRPRSARTLVDIVRAQDAEIALLGGDNLALMLTWPTHHRPLDGVRAAAFFVPDLEDPEVVRVLDEFGRTWRRSMDYSAAFAYDAVHLLTDAIERGGFSRDGVRSALDEMVRSGERRLGVAGAYRLGDDRNARRTMHVVELADGEIRVVARYESADAPASADVR